MKSSLLNSINKYLWGDLQSTIKKIYLEGKSLNKNKVYTYGIFSCCDGHICRSKPLPNKATVDYLTPYIKHFHELTSNREDILSYLLQFMNQVQNISHIHLLLPEELRTLATEAGIVAFSTAKVNDVDKALLENFKQRPEYEQLRAQIIISRM